MADREAMVIIGGLSRRITILTVVFLLLTSPMTSLAVPPEISQKQSDAEKVKAEIDRIDMKLEPVINEFDKANADLEKTKRDIADNTRRLQEAETKLSASRAALNRRLVGIYRKGTVTSVQVIFGSKTFDEFLQRFEMLSRIGRSDSQMVDQVITLKKEVEKRRLALQGQEKQEVKSLAEISQNKAMIEASLAERNQKLASIRSEIDALRQAEAERERQEAEQLQARLQAEKAAAAERVRQAAPVASRGGGAGRNDVVEIAMQYLGVPYVYGGASPSGFDCSGLTMYVYDQVGISLGHYVPDQYSAGAHVSRMELEPGDLVFFNGLGHVGIYVGNGQFIHAPHTGDVVRIDNLDNRYDYVGAVRP
ncbi:MAG: NlpC/P60 family protein [Chloroflexi bacterium]|nr:NlpC/P60 family protein [Chloroflexota bacterium]